MTSEILVMNKGAISLAADSAVTVDGKKVRTGVEKLFKLSDNPSIGMMIFGNANFDNIPMETLIKEYSKKTDFKKLKSLEVIQKDFLNYLARVTPHFDFKKVIWDNLDDYVGYLKEKFKDVTKEEFSEFISNFKFDESLYFIENIDEFSRVDAIFNKIIPSFVLDNEKRKFFLF